MDTLYTPQLVEWEDKTSLWGGFHVTQLHGHHACCISYEKRPLELGNATSGRRNFPVLGDFRWCSPSCFFSPAFFRLGTVTLNQEEEGRASSPKYLCWSLFPPGDVFIGNFKVKGLVFVRKFFSPTRPTESAISGGTQPFVF